MNDLKKLIERIQLWRKYVFLLLLRSPFDALRSWMLANLMKTVFQCVEISDARDLMKSCIFYGLLSCLLFFYNGTVWSIYAAFSTKVEAILQKSVLNHILSMPYKRVSSRKSGEWMTRLNEDIHTAITMMNGPMNIPHFVVATINTVLSSILMLKGSIWMFAVTLLYLLPHLYLNNRVVFKRIGQLKGESIQALEDSTSMIKPLIAEAETILVYDAGNFIMKKCEENSLRLMKTNMKIHICNAISDGVTRLFGLSGYFAVLLVGYYSMNKGTMAFSDVTYCLQVRTSIATGIFMLMTCMRNMKANAVSVKRIKEALEEA